jgi:hypothetical protein
MTNNLLHLLSERTALRRMIEKKPIEDVIDRGSLTSRLGEIEYQISKINPNEKVPLKVRITFGGPPVVGNEGIFADFGTKVLSHFNDAIVAVATSMTGGLAAKGPIPNKSQNQFIITSTAMGSFGFELEEYRTEPLLLTEQSTLGLALKKTQALLQCAVELDDEKLADAVAEINPRALDKIRNFMATLAENDAVCTLQYCDHFFKFKDTIQVRHSLARISQENIQENEQIIKGMFTGVLPSRRTFEFKVNGSEQIIVGKISIHIQNIENINHHLFEMIDIQTVVTQVGKSPPRYSLTALPAW